jgi:hypothetical protein
MIELVNYILTNILPHTLGPSPKALYSNALNQVLQLETFSANGVSATVWDWISKDCEEEFELLGKVLQRRE